MTTVRGIHTGGVFDFQLQGERSTHTVTATVLQLSDAHMKLVTRDGRNLTVPLTAVRTATPHEPKHDHEASQQSQGDIARALHARLAAAQSEPDTAQRLALIHVAMREVEGSVSSKVNRARLAALIDISDRLQAYLDCNDQSRALMRKNEFLAAARKARGLRGYRPRPGTLAAALDSILGIFSDAEKAHTKATWEDSISPPRIVTRDRINITRGRDNEFELPVRIRLDAGATDIEDVRLILDKYRNLKAIGGAPRLERLRGGETATLKARMRDNRKQGARGDIRIEAHATYQGVDGETRESPRQTLNIRILGMVSNDEIPNPFRTYAGGLPVENPQMFFGRQGYVEEFSRELAKPPGGTCFALYGQQRTGKSSVLQQVRSKLIEDGAVVASLSMGTIDRHSMTVDFIEEILDQFRVQINAMLPPQLAGTLLNRWPDAATIERRPMRSFQRAREAARTILRSAGRTGVPFVVVVDEFTYLHEVLRRRGIDPSEHNELRDFMRQLKGLLEAKLFSALLVGQDTMPHFLDSYPNEFSVMSTRKLDYLSNDETEALADEPVKPERDSSRYSGYALATIATYTDGHPFFTQILCDRIITLVNSKKRSDITQSDVEEAVESLIAGQDRIEAHKFDCLVTADNSHALISQMGEDATEGNASKDAQLVLSRIAALSGSQNDAVLIEDLQLNPAQRAALEDLILRGVLRESESRVAIRVLLYADYLRRRSP